MIKNWEGLVTVCVQVLANGEYVPSHENEANILEESSRAEERMINRGSMQTMLGKHETDDWIEFTTCPTKGSLE